MPISPLQPERTLDSMANGSGRVPSMPRAPHFSPHLPLFQFGLRQLFWFVTGLSALLAILASLGGVAALVLTLAALIISAHVSSTALGTRLRAHADEVRFLEARQLEPWNGTVNRSATKLPEARLPPRSPLHNRQRSSRGLMPLLIAGAMLGALTGGIILSATLGGRTSPAGLIIGSLSFAVVGGWITFIGGNFCGIARNLWNDAVAEQRRDDARANRPQ